MIAILALRQPWQFTSASFFEEELIGFWWPTFVRAPLDLLLSPYNGFLYLAPRAAFLAARMLPDQAPFVAVLIHVVMVALVAGFAASDRLAAAIPDRRVRCVGALGLALLPMGTNGVYSTILDVGFWLGIYLALLWLATKPVGRAQAIADLVGAGVAALSGPSSVILAPFFLARAMRRPALAFVVGASAFAQVVTYALSFRRPAPVDPVQLVAIVIGRVGLLPTGDILLGQRVAGWPALVAAIAIIVGLVAWRASVGLPRRTIAVLAWLAGLTAVTGLDSGPINAALSPTADERYFIAAAWLLILVAVNGTIAHRASGLLLAAVFVVAIVPTFVQQPFAAVDWRQPPPAGFRVPVGHWFDGWRY